MLKIPPPQDKSEDPLQGMIFDSWFDSYLGAVSLIRVFSGSIKKGMKMRFMSTEKDYEVVKVAATPKMVDVKELTVGEVGVVTGSIKSIQDTGHHYRCC